MKIARNALDITIESLRFEDENGFLYEIEIKVFVCVLKNTLKRRLSPLPIAKG